jgi:hypothetical protein
MRKPAALLLLVPFAGCSSGPQSYEDLPPELRASTVVVAHDASASVPDAATYAWMPGSGVADDPRYDIGKLDTVIRTSLEDSLRRRGLYRVAAERADYLVGYVVAVEGSLDDGALARKLGSTSGAAHSYEKGALVVDVFEQQRRRSIWRGSITILADPDLSDEVRAQRVRYGVEHLLSRFRQRS